MIWTRIAAAVVGAGVLSLLAPPLNWHALHWVAYLPMFWALREDSPRSNRWLSFLYGTLGVALLFRWIAATIVTFSGSIPWPGAIAILLLFSVVFGLPYLVLWPSVLPLRRRLGVGWVLAIPALQVLLEWASMSVLLFPYNHGVSQYRVPQTWQLVSITGVWGLSFLVFFVNAVLAEWMYRHREGRGAPLGALAGAVATLSLVVLFGTWRYERVEAALADAPVLRVVQVQSDKDMVYRMSHSAREAWDEWLADTARVPPGVADLVVWPEGASPYDLNDSPDRKNLAAQKLAEQARRGGFDLVVGGGTRIRTPDPGMGEDHVEVFNSVYWFRADGTLAGHYDKLVPLPFGEYLPFGSYFPDLARSLGIGDFRAGDEAVVFEGTKVKAATPICYEAILPSVCRLFGEADLLITVTNDAWFGDTANPHQHAMLAAVRATELGVPMVRSAYTGISFVVEPHGVMHSETQPFEHVRRIVEVRQARFPTFYSRFGDWFVAVCGLGLTLAWAATGRR